MDSSPPSAASLPQGAGLEDGHSVIVNGKLLSGTALIEYAKQKGLCPKCVQQVTHRRVRKKISMLRYTYEFEPQTITDAVEGNYTVYKGYCLQPTCWTLQEVQSELGETITSRNRNKSRRKTRSTTTPTRSRDPDQSSSRHRRMGPNQSSFKGERSPGSSKGEQSPGSSLGERSPASYVSDRSSGGMSREESGRRLRMAPRSQQSLSRITDNKSTSKRAASRRASLSTSHITPPLTAANFLGSNGKLDSRSPGNEARRHPSEASGLEAEARRRNIRMGYTSDRNLQSQLSRKNLKKSKSIGDDESRLIRKPVPTAAILHQLLHPKSEGSSMAPANVLWSTLQKRHGGSSSAAESIEGQVTILVHLLETDDTACLHDCWALLACLTSPRNWDFSWGGDEELVETILYRIGCEFDREAGNELKRIAVQVLFNMLEKGEQIPSLECLGSNTRLHWIAVLLDMLMFQSDENDQHDNTTQILFVVWNLLLSKPAASSEVVGIEDSMLMSTIVGIVISILSSECGVYNSTDSDVDGGEGAYFMSESALGLLATVASAGGASVVAGRQKECLMIICETIQKFAAPAVMTQGVNCIRHILASYEDRKVSRNDADSQIVVSKLVDVAMSTLSDQKEELGVLAESASEILVMLLNSFSSARSHLRQTEDAAAKLIDSLDWHQSCSHIQENLCFVLCQLVSLEDHKFGQEIGMAGGVKVITALLRRSDLKSSLVEAALRALVGILTAVDMDVIQDDSVSLSEAVVSTMKYNSRACEIQLAGLDVLHCLCIRDDNVKQLLSFSLAVVVDAMKSHTRTIQLLIRSCSVLRLVGTVCYDWGVFVDTDAVKVIINSMLTHPESTEFVMEGMATIKDFAAEPTFRGHFNYAEAEDAILCLLQVNLHCPEVLAFAFATLNNIVVDSRNRSVAPIHRATLNSIVLALQTYPSEQMVVKNACLLLKSYTYHEGNLELMRQLSDTIVPLLVGPSESQYGETSARAQFIVSKLYAH